MSVLRVYIDQATPQKLPALFDPRLKKISIISQKVSSFNPNSIALRVRISRLRRFFVFISMMKCTECDQTFVTKGQRTAHFRKQHKQQSSIQVIDSDGQRRKLPVTKVNDQWPCPYPGCTYVVQTLRGLQKHCAKDNAHDDLNETTMEAVTSNNQQSVNASESDEEDTISSNTSDEEQEPLLPQGMYLYLILINRTQSVSKTG